MLPSQEHQRPSRSKTENGIKGFMRNLFSSNSRVSSSRNSRAHDLSPNVSTTSLSRQTSIPPANVSSDANLVLRKYTASTPKSAPSLGHTGSGKRIDYAWFVSSTSSPSGLAVSTLTDSRSLTIQAIGNVTPYASPQMVDNIGLGG